MRLQRDRAERVADSHQPPRGEVNIDTRALAREQQVDGARIVLPADCQTTGSATRPGRMCAHAHEDSRDEGKLMNRSSTPSLSTAESPWFGASRAHASRSFRPARAASVYSCASVGSHSSLCAAFPCAKMSVSASGSVECCSGTQ